MSKESRGIEKLNPNEEVGKKRKIVFWSLLATGIGAIIIVVVLLLVFLLPKEEKFEIDLGSNVSVEDGTLIGEGSYKKGDSVTIVAEDIDGYRFTGWSFNGNIISTEKEYTIVIGEDTEGEYTANYAKIYSVSTFDNDNYGSFTVAPIEAIAGETVTVRYEVNSENQDKYQMKRLYYVVAGDLQGTQTTIENNTFTMPEGNVTIYAEFNNLYNINLTTNIDEEVDLTGEGTYIENETVTITAPNVAGYRFRNWTYNGQAVTTQQEYTITNIDSTTSGTYRANYDRLYSITTNSTNGTVTITDNKTEAIENESVSFTVQPNADYRLIEVKVNDETVVAQEGTYSFNMPAGDVTISVTYDREYEITVDSNSSGYIQLDKQNAIAGESVEFTVSDRSGYRITEVKYNNTTLQSESNTYSFNMPAGDVTISVTYDREYAITVDSNSSAYVQIDKQNAIAGESVEFTVSDRTDYRLIEVKVNDETVVAQEGTYSFNMPSQNVTISVTYDREYAITVDSNSSGYVQIEKQNAIAGESVEFTVSDRSGYRITEVKYNNTTLQSELNTYSFSMPAEDVTIAVTYSELFDIEVSSDHGKVTIAENKTEAIANESVSFTIKPSENYRIASVSINDGAVEYTTDESTYSFNMPSQNVTISVTYAIEYAITVDSNSSGYVQIDKQNAIAGELVEFTVSDRAGYRITEVKYNDTTLQSESNIYSFSMPAGNATISVTYSELFDIVVSSNHGTVTITDNKTEAIANENVSFTITPEENYRIESVSINKGSVEYTQDENIYSFTMPAENVTIVVKYIQQLEVILESNIELADPSAMSGGGIEDINTTINLIIPLNLLGSDGNMYKLKGLKFNDNESIISIDESGIYTFTLSKETAGTYTAIYERAYQIDVEQNSNIKVAIDEDKMMAVEGEDVSFTVEVDPGYRLLSVEANQITLEEKDGKYSFKMPAEDVSIKVTIAQVYNITVNQNANASIQVDKTQAIKDESVEITVQANSGYRITGVYYTLNSEKQEITLSGDKYILTMPEGNVEISVEVVGQYQITLNSNIDSEVPDIALEGAGLYDDGASVTIKAPNVAGYRFRNWTYNDAMVTTDQEYTITGIGSATSGTYIANYDRLYLITVNSTNGTVTIAENKTEAIENESVSFTVQPDADYRLIEVKVNDETVVAQDGKYTFAMPAEDVTIAVTYSELFDIIVTSEHGTVTIGESKTEAIANENVSFTITPEENYRIANVSINNGDVTYTNEDNTYSFTMPAENVTIDVTYSQLFDISVTSDHGTVTIGENKTEAIANESVSFTVQPDADYRLIEVKVNDETVVAQEGTYSFNMPAGNATISVTYDREYAITVDSNSSEYVQIEKQNAIAGESVEFTVSERTGYRITEVKYNDTTLQSESNTYSFNMPAGDATISVTYSELFDIIVTSEHGMVTIAENKTEAIENESVSFTVQPNADYRLIEVKVNDDTVVAQEGTYSFNMPAGNATISVTYSELFDIKVSSDHGTVIITDNKTEAIANESVSFTIEPSENYRIASVSINGGAVEYTTDESTYSFSMPAGDATISVTYDREYAITVDSNSSAYVQIEKQNAIAGESVEFTVLDRTDYRLIEVKVNNETVYAQEGTYSFNMPAGDVTISVTYSELFDIIVTSEHGTVTIGENKTEAIENESVSFTVQPDADYRLIEVKVNDETVVAQDGTYSFNMPAGDATISVTYDREYAITVDSNSSGYVQIDKQNAIAGESVEFTVSERTGYRITEVKYNETTLQSESNTYSFNMPAGDATIAVTYSELYDILVTSNYGTVTITDNKTEAIADESVSFTVQPNADYRLIEVKVNNETVVAQEGTYSFNMPAEDVTISVTYSELFDIVVSSDHGKVTIAENKTEAIENESVSFTVQPNADYRLIEVKINNETVVAQDGTYSFNMPAGDVTISVTYSIEYAITVDSNSSEYVQIDKQNAIAGESVEFTVSDRAGYRITEVKYNNATLQSDSNTYSFSMPAGDVTIAVTYAREYAVAIDSSASGKVTGVNVSTAINGEKIIVYANIQDSVEDNTVTLEGLYYIESGSEDRVPINQIDGQYSFTMPANNVTIYAESQTYRRLDDFTFSRNSITDYTGSASQLTLPAYYDRVTVNSQNYKIEKDTGTQITSIEWKAFTGCRSLTSITIPEGVTSIGDYAFSDCTSLTEITIPEGVTSIGISAFSDCSSLTSITIPEGVTSIGSGAFWGCTSLTSITIPEGVTSIGSDAFTGCRSLTSITIPKGVTSIGERAFQSCSSLTSITLPNSLTSIGGGAFTGCRSLTSITLPNSLTSIGGDAFLNCYALAIVYNNSNLEIVAGATTYGGVAQYAKEVVKNGGTAKGRIETAGNVQYYINSTTGNYIALAPSIGRGEITSIKLIEGTTEINQYAFQSCSSLTSITLPNSLTSIGLQAFIGCYALAIVYNNSNLEIVAGSSFNGGVARYAHEVVKNGGVAQGRFEVSNNVNYYINDVTNEKVAIYVVDKDVTSVTLAEDTTEIQAGAFSSCTSLTSITIPEGVTSIGGYTFQNCTSLTEITIPEGVTSIGIEAFYNCTSLTSITLPNSLTSIGSYAFYDCTSLTSITIESDDVYKVATSATSAGYLLQRATTVRVLTTIVNTYDNSYLENISKFSTNIDGEYTVFTKR